MKKKKNLNTFYIFYILLFKRKNDNNKRDNIKRNKT